MHLSQQERVEEGEIDPHTPLFINITYTKKRPSFRQNSWCAKGRMLPWLGVLIRPTVGDLFLLLSILSWYGPPSYLGSADIEHNKILCADITMT